jgi:hypothetical protein
LKKNIGIALMLALGFSAWAQEIAITERGDSVMLNANGTWDYLSNLSSEAEAERIIKENPREYKKPSSSKAESKGLGDAYRVYYNNEIWRRVSPSELNEEADLAWSMKKGDAYGMVIFEEIEINMEDLSQIAFDNALELSDGLEMVNREYRNVNGEDLVFMEMAGKMGGINVTYYSYYFSNENGSIQFHTFTGTQVLDKYRETFDSLLSGLIVNC